MKIVKGKEQEYKDRYEKNSDPYGRACFTYAERWAGMMEEKIKASEDNEIDAMSGATITTNATTNGVNAAIFCFKYITGGAE